ncbi:MND1-interacting protein 1 [Quillaja saponaria]|uniref:MND1-interacting protein 1 n=1 Tax=Quillaja saponaria TaxID=32244 RepID=A0AAD7VEH3_QUISA|nr:MND1-interacting protein 1 [Quillaja saponaria]
MGDKDPVSIMVHDTLSSLKAKDISTEQDDAFDNLQHLVQYTMLEMISVVQEVRPSLTVGEAMWWLILCDLNVSQACEMEEDPLSGFTTISDPKEPSLPNISLSKQQGVEAVKFQSTASRETSQATASEGKLGPRRKGHNLKELSALRQRSIQLEKTYRTHSNRKGAFKAGKLTNTGGAIIGKTPIPPSEITSVHVKGASSNICADFPSTDAAGTAPAKESSGTLMSPSALPTMDTHPSASGKKSNPTSELDTSHTPELADYYAGIPYDESLGVCVPRNKQDELILKLVPRLQGLQNELQYWTDWANKKVMQAAQRLRKYQAELKALRRVKEEAEQFEKEKQIFEDNTMKRLSDMESALSNTASQYEKASSAIPILEAENFKLKEELNAAKLWASESMTSHEKALEREQMALRKIQSLEGQKSSFREELEREKHKATELKPEISKMQNLRSQTEIRWEQERVAKERVLAQAASTKREREQLEAQAQAREDLLRQKADDGIQKYVEYIRKLEIKLSEWKWKSDCARIAALHRGTDGSCSSYSAEKRNPNSEDDNASGSLRRDRECVMCLSEESSVVFLPCAHQIVCEKCNELHDKEGMKDCPSCRAPIESRVHARYDRP